MQNILTALSNPTRRAALAILWDGSEHCVCELMERRKASQKGYPHSHAASTDPSSSSPVTSW